MAHQSDLFFQSGAILWCSATAPEGRLATFTAVRSQDGSTMVDLASLATSSEYGSFGEFGPSDDKGPELWMSGNLISLSRGDCSAVLRAFHMVGDGTDDIGCAEISLSILRASLPASLRRSLNLGDEDDFALGGMLLPLASMSVFEAAFVVLRLSQAVIPDAGSFLRATPTDIKRLATRKVPKSARKQQDFPAWWPKRKGTARRC